MVFIKAEEALAKGEQQTRKKGTVRYDYPSFCYFFTTFKDENGLQETVMIPDVK